MDKLLEAYSGDKARGYDARRSESKRWQRELVAMERMLAAVKPRTVLDCPFGTGRWVEQYEAIGANVIGIDLSNGMLEEAASKIAALSSDRKEAYSLECRSIFDLQLGPRPAPDLTVCIRFLNWVDFADAERALERLTELGSPAMIIGASLVLGRAGLFRRLWYRFSLGLINLRGRNRPQQHVHRQEALMATIERLGWRVVDQREIMRRNARVNYFFRLERS